MSDLQSRFDDLKLCELYQIDLSLEDERKIHQLARQCITNLQGGRGKECLARGLVGLSMCMQALEDAGRDQLYSVSFGALQDLLGRFLLQYQQLITRINETGLLEQAPGDLLLMTELALRSFYDVQLLQLPRALRQTPRGAGLLCNYLQTQVALGVVPVDLLEYIQANSSLLRVVLTKTQSRSVCSELLKVAVLAQKVCSQEGLNYAVQTAAALTPVDEDSEMRFALAEDDVQREIDLFYNAELIRFGNTRVQGDALVAFVGEIAQLNPQRFTPGCSAFLKALRALPAHLQRDLQARVAPALLKSLGASGLFVIGTWGISGDAFISGQKKEAFYGMSLVLKALYERLWPASGQILCHQDRAVFFKALNSVSNDLILHAAYQPYLQRVGAPLTSDFARRILQHLFLTPIQSQKEVPGTLQKRVSLFVSGEHLNGFLQRDEVSARLDVIVEELQFMDRLQNTRFSRGYSSFNWIFQAALQELRKAPQLVEELSQKGISLNKFVSLQAIQTQRLTLPQAGQFQVTTQQLEAELQGGPVTLERVYREKPQLLMFIPFLAEIGTEAYIEVLDQIAQKETHLRTQSVTESSYHETSTITTTQDDTTTAEFSVISEAIDNVQPQHAVKEAFLISDFLREKAQKQELQQQQQEPLETSSIMKDDGDVQDDEFKLVFK